MNAGELAFLREARIGRLATVNARHEPTVVPICFAVVEWSDGPALVSVLDEKPKRVADAELARVRHIRRNPSVCLVADRYDEDWSRLAFVQARGMARIVQPGAPGHLEAIAALRAKYPQYRTMAIEQRAAIVIERLSAFSWKSDRTRFE